MRQVLISPSLPWTQYVAEDNFELLLVLTQPPTNARIRSMHPDICLQAKLSWRNLAGI